MTDVGWPGGRVAPIQMEGSKQEPTQEQGSLRVCALMCQKFPAMLPCLALGGRARGPGLHVVVRLRYTLA